MKWILAVSVSLVALIVIGLADVTAQAQMGWQMPMMGQIGQQDQPAGLPPMMGGGIMGQGMMGMPMMGPMMGGRMGSYGMGMGRMMGSGQMDPKVMGRMLQLRGDILKAIGEVMLKHGKAMEEAK